MDEQQYKAWWQLHRRAAVGEPLSDEEERAYQAGLAALEAEEWAELRPATELLRPLQEQLRELTAHNQQLAQEEAALRARAAELERNYRAVTGEPLGLEI
jgi:serine phosphatase RsbU (regulator of sigma subunit)